MRSIVVVGGQWGDEGKGKIVDLLAEQADHVVRAQGGANAGHTVVVSALGKQLKLHLIPSGILHAQCQCYLAAGVALDPEVLLEEMEALEKAGLSLHKRLWVSEKAHLVLPYHKVLDRLIEERRGGHAVGTTGRGIGPCYADKAQRTGFRAADLKEPTLFAQRLKEAVEQKNRLITRLYDAEPLDVQEVLETMLGYAASLFPYVTDVEKRLFAAQAREESLLLEGAQGTLLDLDFGTYPFVTASHTTAAGICQGAGIAPGALTHTLGVFKAYATRVGEGPFPTESNALFGRDRAAIREIGTTTGRARRIGWFDAVLGKQSVQLNGIDSVAMTKLDILDECEEIQVCTHYAEDRPVYRAFTGWRSSTRKARRLQDLPVQAQEYLHQISSLIGAPIGLVSVGPDREDTIRVSAPFFREAV